MIGAHVVLQAVGVSDECNGHFLPLRQIRVGGNPLNLRF
jgi:hypothetical protein